MTFEYSFWLYCIPAAILILAALFITWSIASKRRLRAFASASLLPELLKSYSKRRASIKYSLVALGILGLLATLARPQYGYIWEDRPSSGVDIIFAVDASRSMLAEDIKPNRLERSKFAVLDLLKKLGGHRVGLVAFAGGAFLQCPLTFDYDAFKQSLEAIDTRIIFKGGSNLGLAIRESSQAFQKGKNKKIIVVFTDGEDLGSTSIEAAEEASNENITIYTIGVGTPEGEIIPIRLPNGGIDYVRDDKNRLVKSKLDEATLTQVAETTNGFYARLGNTNWSLETIYNAGIEPTEEAGAERLKIPLERFQWPLAFALACLAIEPLIGRRKRSLRKRNAHTLILLSIVLFTISTSALKANEDTNLYNEGTQLYQEGHFQEASEKLHQALETGNLDLQEKTFYNLGNARYREGQVQRATNPQETKRLWEASVKDYKNTLELDPKNENAAHNKAVVEKALEELNKELEQKEQQQDQNKSESQDKEQNESQENQGENGGENNPEEEENSSDQQSNNQEKGNQEESSSGEQEDQPQSPESEQQEQETNEASSGDKNPMESDSEKQEDKGPEDQQGNEQVSESKDSKEEKPQDGEHNNKQERLSTDPDRNPLPPPESPAPAEGTMSEEQQREAIRNEEAARLLDSLKSEERKLPYTGSQDKSDTNGPTQDW